MATRRPRVPKTSQRQLADVGAGASSRAAGFHPGYDVGPAPRFEGAGSASHPVGGYSAKVIPLDAAPSRHGAAAAPGTAGTAGTEGPEAEASAAEGPGVEAPELESEVEPELTPEQRRAETRSTLLSRSTPRLRRKNSQRRRTSASSAAAAAPQTHAMVEPVPARNFTGRSVAFLVVLFVAAVLLAPTLRVFLDQQAELRAVQEDIVAERQLEQDFTNEISRWDDPAYIQQQARERFNLVMPGEQTYMVIGGDEAVEDPVPAPASPGEVNPDLPWADALWDSVVRAGTD
ncbi:FtsB family cell division protein [Microbacterium sp. A93]|uniref:FtsB family cell division protein n=1 Tax=Microbacterium sp. A93 TaxID=3450716 RepID=UPI003F433546